MTFFHKRQAERQHRRLVQRGYDDWTQKCLERQQYWRKVFSENPGRFIEPPKELDHDR